MSELEEFLGATVEKIFADHVTTQMRLSPDVSRSNDTGATQCDASTWHASTWAALEDNGLTRALVPESNGGAGATWSEVYRIVEALGRAAAPVPLGETIVANAIVATKTRECPSGLVTIAADSSQLRLSQRNNAWRISGHTTKVPWGRYASFALTQIEFDGARYFVLLPRENAVIACEHNLAGEPRDTLEFNDAAVAVFAANSAQDADDQILRYGALLRVAQATGAMSSVQSRTLAYAAERVQFGRALAKFQAIQHYLADLACHSAQAEVAASAAYRAMDAGSGEFAVAEAKVVVGQAIELATRIGHQIHGAIGFTAEHDLHFFTQRLWSWKAEFGSTAFWAERLGRAALARGADQLWSDITLRQAQSG